jgi:hypothetical protein
MFGRPVGVNREACLKGEGGVILKRATIDGGDTSRRISAAGTNGDRGEGTKQLVGAVEATTVNGVHEAER